MNPSEESQPTHTIQFWTPPGSFPQTQLTLDRGGSGWISGKDSSSEVVEQAPQSSSHGIKLTRDQEVTQNNTLKCTVWFLGGPMWYQELDLMILLGPFQLQTFSDSMTWESLTWAVCCITPTHSIEKCLLQKKLELHEWEYDASPLCLLSVLCTYFKLHPYPLISHCLCWSWHIEGCCMWCSEKLNASLHKTCSLRGLSVTLFDYVMFALKKQVTELPLNESRNINTLFLLLWLAIEVAIWSSGQSFNAWNCIGRERRWQNIRK